MWVTSHI